MSETIRLEVRRLLTEPAVASGCCAVLAGDVIRDELMDVPGVKAVSVEQKTGRVTVSFDASRTNALDIRDALRGINYPAEDVA